MRKGPRQPPSAQRLPFPCRSVLLAPAAHGPRVLVPDDGSPADILPGDLAAALLLPQSQSAGALGPPAARPPLRPPGTGHHHLQQAPERQAPLRHLARADRAAGRAVCQRAVRRRGAPALPQADEELDAGQAQAVPRNLGAGGLPAGLCQPDAGHVLPVVHHLGDQCLLVPRHAVSPSHQPGYHEPGEQRLPVPQAEPALSAQHGSELPLREPARPGLVPTAPHGGPLLTQGLFRT
ncbi:cytochrome b561 domain-containing protein 2 [Columba livia]|uniref:Cytochrome b561 domain-containing protein 2 n=1 Tax=Columba livia TaxID=8932 RepID=A0A2I0LGN5_COLLI|nr:cytochrome b561 domain-containing protein 2 [Columba livia]